MLEVRPAGRIFCALAFMLFFLNRLPAAAQVEIYPGADIQSIVNAHGPWTYYVLKSGVHRMQTITPKTGDWYVGEPGTVLSGARLLTNFTRAGNYWVVGGQWQQGPVSGSEWDSVCRSGYPRCGYPEDLFINGAPLQHVGSLGAVGPGKWYFDYGADQIYFWDDPWGKTVETSVTAKAFNANGATNVTLWNLIVEKYAVPTGGAAVVLGPSWLMQYSVSRLNHYSGVWTNTNSVTRYSYIAQNGCFGFQGAGDNILVEQNEIAYNGYAGYNPFWASGGTKWSYTRNLTLRGNYSHHNSGPGLWTDVDNIYTVFESNTVDDNERGGIFHELSYDAVIRWNTARRNGAGKAYPWWTTGAGIEILSSPNVEIYGNYLENNFQGITALHDHRGTGRYGPWAVTNLQVHDNTIHSRGSEPGAGRTGMIDTWGNGAFAASERNRFYQNSYVLGSAAKYHMWMSDERNEWEWQGFGQDTTGSFSR